MDLGGEVYFPSISLVYSLRIRGKYTSIQTFAPGAVQSKPQPDLGPAEPCSASVDKNNCALN